MGWCFSHFEKKNTTLILYNEICFSICDQTISKCKYYVPENCKTLSKISKWFSLFWYVICLINIFEIVKKEKHIQ